MNLRHIIILSILISIFLTISLSCISQKKFNVNSFQRTQASHRIKNQIIMKPISRMIEKIKEKKSLLDVILLRTDWLNSNEKNVYLKASNFETEQMYYQNDNNKLKPKGYLWVDDIFVLLYNDTNTFFSKINEPKDILKNDKEIKLLVDVHTSYYHYIYRKDTIYGNIEEYIEIKGEMDEIEN